MLERRLLLVTGKGGTGRSVIAASLAIAAARRGQRVLALALDGADGLARHLGCEPPGATPRRHGDLHVAAVEPGSALDEYLRLRLRVPRIATATRLFAAVAETVPGVRDTIVIGKTVYESTRPRWDLVVADAPPLGQVQSLLAAPETIAGLVPTGAVREQAEWLGAHLSDPEHTGVVLVATAEELPVLEATAFLASSAAIPIAAVVANRILADDVIPTAGTGPESAAAAHHHALATAQQPHLQALQSTETIPMMFGMHTPVETAARIADLWGRS